ncbi:MAG: radical SAM protein [Bacteroidales bacterium]|nr:radical SAM protein [Bacteroidales bacterium]
MKCNLCPRHCTADRVETLGFCHARSEPEAATVCIHRGEEPPLCGTRGICNVFFAHCNLQCIYCQNYQISHYQNIQNIQNIPTTPPPRFVGIDAIVDEIARLLPETENMVGFVTPTHYADSLPAIVERLHERGLYPTTVYNTGGYDSVATLRMLAPYIDIYLPDYKYSDPNLAQHYSHAADYPQVALAALREMYNQKGSALPTDERGMAYRGIIVRHLVLPGQVENSLRVLDTLADLSLNLHISLMAQYYPPLPDLPDQLGRTISQEEYRQVTDHLNALGLCRGWVQELDAQKCYRPDFTRQQAF